MPLLSFWKASPDDVRQLSIEQVVANAGDGILKDHSACSEELREYLRYVPTSKIGRYTDHCLSSGFQKSGMVLQDLVNELGRRLDYEVTDGLYQGTVNSVGFDGIWRSPEQHNLIIEVKTTDAYRLSLDTLADYRSKLTANGQVSKASSVLIVVGRKDTGELEAQIRGSRHAWDMRLISVEALLKLVALKENSEAPDTGLKIRSVLTPVEYTRLDRMIDVMFTTVKDVEISENDTSSDTTGDISDQEDRAGTWQVTDATLLQQKRDQIVAALAKRENTSFIRKSRALYRNPTDDVRLACAISKRYLGKNQNPYWYAFHPAWDEFLSAAQIGFYVLGCMDLNVAFAIPYADLKAILGLLHTTVPQEGDPYWHVQLRQEAGGLSIILPKQQKGFSLEPYAMPLT
jgi:hypothetical protein